MNTFKQLLPLHLILMDVVGSFITVVGIIEFFEIGELIPENLRFENDAIIFIVLGISFTAPLIIHIIKQVLLKRRLPK